MVNGGENTGIDGFGFVCTLCGCLLFPFVDLRGGGSC